MVDVLKRRATNGSYFGWIVFNKGRLRFFPQCTATALCTLLERFHASPTCIPVNSTVSSTVIRVD